MFSGQKSAKEAGQYVNGINANADLVFGKFHFIEEEGQEKQQDTGQYVGKQQGADQGEGPALKGRCHGNTFFLEKFVLVKTRI